MEIADYKKQSRDYWKGKISFVVFTNKCNYKCPYCFVPDVVKGKETIKTRKIMKELHRVRAGVDAIVITGGEPCLYEDLPIFAKKFKMKDLPVKIWTNGTKPNVIQKLIERNVVDFIAMDLKAPFSKYGEVTGTEKPETEKVKKSKEILEDSEIDHEFITTWSPDLTEKDVIKTGNEVKTNWVLQKFEPKNCLNKEYCKKKSKTLEEMEETARKVKKPKEVRIRAGRMERVIE